MIRLLLHITEFIATVKVCGKVYRSCESFKRVIDAQQSAASEALKALQAVPIDNVESGLFSDYFIVL